MRISLLVLCLKVKANPELFAKVVLHKLRCFFQPRSFSGFRLKECKIVSTLEHINVEVSSECREVLRKDWQDFISVFEARKHI